MVEWEADDALAAAADRFESEPSVERIVICTVDKDLAQCVRDERVVLWDRRRDLTYDAAGVRAKWGVDPASIPDYLALVGDSSDGYPGIPGFGSKTAAALLAKYGHFEDVPAKGSAWDVAGLRNSVGLAAGARRAAGRGDALPRSRPTSNHARRRADPAAHSRRVALAGGTVGPSGRRSAMSSACATARRDRIAGARADAGEEPVRGRCTPRPVALTFVPSSVTCFENEIVPPAGTVGLSTKAESGTDPGVVRS